MAIPPNARSPRFIDEPADEVSLQRPWAAPEWTVAPSLPSSHSSPGGRSPMWTVPETVPVSLQPGSYNGGRQGDASPNQPCWSYGSADRSQSWSSPRNVDRNQQRSSPRLNTAPSLSQGTMSQGYAASQSNNQWPKGFQYGEFNQHGQDASQFNRPRLIRAETLHADGFSSSNVSSEGVRLPTRLARANTTALDGSLGSGSGQLTQVATLPKPDISSSVKEAVGVPPEAHTSASAGNMHYDTYRRASCTETIRTDRTELFHGGEHSFKHFIQFPILRLWFVANCIAAFLLSFFSCESTVWFKMPRIDGGFPYANLAYGPWKVDHSSYRRGMDMTEWVSEACAENEVGKYEFYYWAEYLMRKLEENDFNHDKGKIKKNKEDCIDAAGYWCRRLQRIDSQLFSKNCNGNGNLRKKCAQTCGVCAGEGAMSDQDQYGWVESRHTACGMDSSKAPSGIGNKGENITEEDCQQRALADRYCSRQVFFSHDDRKCFCVEQGKLCDQTPKRGYSLWQFTKISSLPLKAEAKAFCKFREAVVKSLQDARMALRISLLTLILVIVLCFLLRWKACVVLACFVLQLGTCGIVAWGLWPLAFEQHAVGKHDRDVFLSFLEDRQNDVYRLQKLKKAFSLYVQETPEWTVELKCSLFALVFQILGIIWTFEWFMYLKWRKTPRSRRSSWSRSGALIVPLLRVVSIGRFLRRCCGLRTKAPMQPGARYRMMSRRLRRCFGFAVPHFIGRIVGDLRALFGHLQRMFEWHGFLGDGNICSEAEVQSMIKLGITHRCVQNILSWRRSVLTLALTLGVLIMPLSFLNVWDAMKRSTHEESVTPPILWHDFKAFFYAQKRMTSQAKNCISGGDGFLRRVLGESPLLGYGVKNATRSFQRRPRYDDYLRCMSVELGRKIWNLEREPRLWIAIIDLFAEGLTVGFVYLGLISYLWPRTSRNLVVWGGLLQVYAPVVASFVPIRYLVRGDSLIELDAFLVAFGRESARALAAEKEVANCWQHIDRSMNNLYLISNTTQQTCKILTFLKESFLPEPAIQARDFCKKYLSKEAELIEKRSKAEGHIRGICVGLQNTYFGDKDPEVKEGSYNATSESRIESAMNKSLHRWENMTKFFHKGVLTFIAVKAGALSFLSMLPSTISLLPSVLYAAWRVRLSLPLARLPCTLLRGLPFIYLPLFWIQFLPFWQLLNNYLLFFGVSFIMAATYSYSITSNIFSPVEPMPGEELYTAIVKQGHVNLVITIIAYAILLGWLLSDRYAWSMSDLIRDWAFSRNGVQTICRYFFKFLVLRVLALDFIVRQMTLDHLYDLGLDAIRRAARTRALSSHSHSEVSSYYVSKYYSTMSSQRPRGYSETSDPSEVELRQLTGATQKSLPDAPVAIQSAPQLDMMSWPSGFSNASSSGKSYKKRSSKTPRAIYGDVSAVCDTIPSGMAMECELDDELAAGVYGEENADKVNWEWLAIEDVLKAETKHRGAIEAILDIERDLAVRHPDEKKPPARTARLALSTFPTQVASSEAEVSSGSNRPISSSSALLSAGQADVQVITTQRIITSQSAVTSGFQHQAISGAHHAGTSPPHSNGHARRQATDPTLSFSETPINFDRLMTEFRPR